MSVNFIIDLPDCKRQNVVRQMFLHRVRESSPRTQSTRGELWMNGGVKVSFERRALDAGGAGAAAARVVLANRVLAARAPTLPFYHIALQTPST